jgi:drug/metabolite transporter (DMT)-like permease
VRKTDLKQERHSSGLDIRATGVLFLSVFFMSLIPLFLRYFTPYVDGWTANGLRYPVAAFVYLPWLFYSYHKKRVKGNVWRKALLPSGFNIIGQCFWAWSPYYIEPGMIGFLLRFSIVWAVTGSFILFPDERPLLKSRRFWLGIAAAAIGLYGMIFQGTDVPSGGTLTGIIMILACSLFFALYNLMVRRNLSDTDPRLAFSVVSIYTSAGVIAFFLAFGDVRLVSSIPGNVMALIILSAIAGIGVVHVLLYYSFQHVGVAITTGFSLLSAFITATLSYFIFGEKLTIGQWFSGVVLLSGSLLLLWSQEKIKIQK